MAAARLQQYMGQCQREQREMRALPFFYTIHSEYCIIQVLQALISLIHEVYILCSWREKERNREIKTKSRGDRFFTQLHFFVMLSFFLNQISFTHENIYIRYYGYSCLMEMTFLTIQRQTSRMMKLCNRHAHIELVYQQEKKERREKECKISFV